MKIKKHHIAKIHNYCKKRFILKGDDAVTNKVRNMLNTGIQFWLDQITDDPKKQGIIFDTIRLYQDNDDLIEVYRAIKDKGYDLEV